MRNAYVLYSESRAHFIASLIDIYLWFFVSFSFSQFAPFTAQINLLKYKEIKFNRNQKFLPKKTYFSSTEIPKWKQIDRSLVLFAIPTVIPIPAA